jgi:hypothetical protein
MDDLRTLRAILYILAGGFVYLIPAIIASCNHKRNEQAIFVLNLLAGWTVIGWIVAMVWACCYEAPEPEPKR